MALWPNLSILSRDTCGRDIHYQVEGGTLMANGYWQKLLRVDLSTRESRVETISEGDLKRFIGGAGLGAEILRREVASKTPAYEPQNRVIFATGPFQGHPIAGGANHGDVYDYMISSSW